MDGGRRLDQPLMRSGPQRGAEAEGVDSPLRLLARDRVGRRHRRVGLDFGRLHRRLDGARSLAWVAAYRARLDRFARRPPPLGLGIVGTVMFLALALGYGALLGGHMPAVLDWLKDARDQAA